MVATFSSSTRLCAAFLVACCVMVQLTLAQQCPSSQPNCECNDLTTSCNSSYCNSTVGQAWCSSTCQSCDVRKRCFNALGDAACESMKQLCLLDPYFPYICRQTCQSCGSITPVTNSNTSCQDLSTTCNSSFCNNEAGQVWCAQTCSTCSLRNRCFNAYGDAFCDQQKALCTEDAFWPMMCKKTCTNNCGAGYGNATGGNHGVGNSTDCQDLTDDCKYIACDTDHQKVWCAKTCGTCNLRDVCYNADGDSDCARMKTGGLCTAEPFTKVICKQACTNCTASSSCSDLTYDCKNSPCQTDHQKIWCAGTCNACSMRNTCYNADGDADCAKMAASGMCQSEPYVRYTCKKACGAC